MSIITATNDGWCPLETNLQTLEPVRKCQPSYFYQKATQQQLVLEATRQYKDSDQIHKTEKTTKH